MEHGPRPDRLQRHALNYANCFNLSQSGRYHQRRALQTRLEQTANPLKIMCIGYGSAISPFACKCLDHQAEGFDIESPMYFEMAKILGVNIRDYTVKALPLCPTTFKASIRFPQLRSSSTVKISAPTAIRPENWKNGSFPSGICPCASPPPGGRIVRRQMI
ncbi:hypothetical protein [Pseudothioclava arenosa]|uniref:hypothetical protein n=1 Tax=Pseudothioclava arenosa TaxID=1795308 RepID=UPI0011804188|nr:hypothetical protein [Pseudothioclava arenosa]